MSTPALLCVHNIAFKRAICHRRKPAITKLHVHQTKAQQETIVFWCALVSAYLQYAQPEGAAAEVCLVATNSLLDSYVRILGTVAPTKNTSRKRYS